MLTKSDKEKMVSQLTDDLKGSETAVFVTFHGLSVADAAELRAKLAEDDVSYRVVRKTLAKRALNAVGADGDLPELPGELAIAWGSETAPARGVYDFQKSLNEAVSIVGGIFEGRFLTKEEMVEIAEIPSLETLRGMFVNVINSPIAGLAVALGQIAEKKGATST